MQTVSFLHRKRSRFSKRRNGRRLSFPVRPGRASRDPSASGGSLAGAFDAHEATFFVSPDLGPLANLHPRVDRQSSRSPFPRHLSARVGSAERLSAFRVARFEREPRLVPSASTCPPRLSHPRGAPTRLPPTPPRATRRRSWRAFGRLRWRSCVARDASRSGESKKTRTSRPSANLPIATRPESRRKRGPFLKTTPFRTLSVTSHSCVCAQSSPREPRPPRVLATRRRLSRRR